MPPRPYGSILREARLEAGAIQSRLAAAAGVSVAYVSQVERGVKNPPPLETTRAWLAVLGCPDRIDEFVSASDRSASRLSVSLRGKAPHAIDMLVSITQKFERCELTDRQIAAILALVADEEGRSGKAYTGSATQMPNAGSPGIPS